ncbi:KRI1-like family C-terminal-domain-containing protein [Cubamyces menziesii]|nr:KRI1-like family C-terminal-domain-containing protein [Cubamyces menziesii]
MLSDDSDVEDIHTLTINEHYAKAFEYRKEREELAKLKEKYGSDIDEDAEDDEDSEEAESEDEDGEELTPAVDAAILRTLARIKRKDPAIYEQGKDIFEEEKQRTQDVQITRRANKDKSKPVTMRQHALASALEDAQSRSPSPQPLTHMEEQEELRKETISAFHTAVKPQDDVEEDDFLVPREKTKDEIEQEEEEYRAFLQREVGEDLTGLVTVDPDSAGILDGADEEEPVGGKKKKAKQEEKKEKKPAKNKQEEDQEFLMNYILNRGWIDKSARRLPTYKEITGSKKGKGKSEAGSDTEASGSESDEDRHSAGGGPDASLDEDDFDEVADRFESSYNFRFEEPGAADIARYPRNIPDVVRRQDTARKEAREKKKARKEEELLKKKEEVKRLKALKMKEIRAKLERISHEGGKKLEETEALQELDLEGEWDPSKHDQQMAKIFANDSVEDGDVDEEKPHWDDDIDIGDIVPPEEEDGDSKKKKKKKKKKKDEDEDGMDEGGVDIDEMDAEVERPPADEEEWDGTEEMRKRKLEEYMDEIYGLDFNDMVAGMPTRFKYTKVEPQNFGLTPAEILMATDAELNSYMGVKKLAPYRKEGKGRTWDSKRAARLKELKTKLKERGVSGSIDAAAAAQEKKKRKGKKERMREKAMAASAGGATGGGGGGGGGDDDDGEERDGHDGEDGDEPRKNGCKRKSEEADEQQEGGEASSKKRRRRHKKSTATAAAP